MWRGVTIPWLADGYLWKVQIRRWHDDPRERYRAIRGSVNCGLYGVNHRAGRPICAFVEGEFDAMLLWQEAGDLVDVYTLGGAGIRLATRWLPLFWNVERCLIATDNDKDGNEAAEAIRKRLGPRATRLLPPGGVKDVTDAWAAGADLRGWLSLAITNNQGE